MRCRVNPQRKKQDSIAAGRHVLKRSHFDAFKCADLLEALRNYHFEYDPKQRIFSDSPSTTIGRRMRRTLGWKEVQHSKITLRQRRQRG